MSLCLNFRKQPIQAEFNQPLSKIKPLVVKEPREIKLMVINNAKETAESQSQIAKERDFAKKQKMEDFQNKIKMNATKIQKENKEIRNLSQIQKMTEKTRFLNVSRDYAERSLNLFKKKRISEEEEKNQKICLENIMEEISGPPKAEVIYPKMEEDMEEIDESTLKSVYEIISDYVSLREKLKRFNFLDSQTKTLI